MEVPVVSFPEIDSTNAEARRRAEAGETGPLWLTAERQTAGRGRRGRAWSTEPGNLAATCLFTTHQPPAKAAQVSFVAALAVCDAVRGYVGAERAKVKWPNDVLIGTEKVSGILVESGKRPDGRIWVAVGIGLNLAHHPAGVEHPATHVGAHISPTPDPGDALLKLIVHFRGWLEVWEEQGFEAIRDAWTERAYNLGKPGNVRLPNETLQGLIEGLDVDGAMRLRLADGTIRRITAGDVFFGAA